MGSSGGEGRAGAAVGQGAHGADAWHLRRAVSLGRQHSCPVDEGLCLGSVGAALNKEALKTLNVTHPGARLAVPPQ